MTLGEGATQVFSPIFGEHGESQGEVADFAEYLVQIGTNSMKCRIWL